MKKFNRIIIFCMVVSIVSGVLLVKNSLISKASHSHIWAEARNEKKHF